MLYKVERIEDVFDEISYLAQCSHEELELNKFFGVVEINKELYLTLEKNKSLLLVSARNEEKSEIVGYAIYFIAESIFNKKKQAESHSFYIKKEYRKGFNARNMFLFAEKKLKERKVEILLQKLNVNKDISKLFERMQYKHIENVFLKEL